MSDDKMIHPNSPVHFEHWCDYDECKRGGHSGRSAAAAIPNGAALSTWPSIIEMGGRPRGARTPTIK